MNLQRINSLIVDVDGVLTPGDVSFVEDDRRVMSFSIHDGLAIKLWRRAGHRVGVLSGRRSPIVERRAAELGIAAVVQGAEDKSAAYVDLLRVLETTPDGTCCIGDDWPDVAVLRNCGFAVVVANAAPAVKRWADYVTRRPGGGGAVAEVIELILRRQDRWRAAVGNTVG